MKIPLSEYEALMADIAAGRVTVEPDGEKPGCQLFWRTSNGWRLEVFDDCGQWDYVDSVVAPDGRELEFDDFIAADFNTRTPTEAELHRIWWHPGWSCKYPTKRPGAMTEPLEPPRREMNPLRSPKCQECGNGMLGQMFRSWDGTKYVCEQCAPIYFETPFRCEGWRQTMCRLKKGHEGEHSQVPPTLRSLEP